MCRHCEEKVDVDNQPWDLKGLPCYIFITSYKLKLSKVPVIYLIVNKRPCIVT